MRARALRWHAALVRRFLPAGEHDELGLTLVELLLAIAIETVLFGALAAAFISSMTGSSTVSENLARSTDARLAAAYIVSDARNSSGPELSLTDIVSCADAHPPVTGTQTPVARFSWDAPTRTGGTTANISNYVLVSGNLLRRHCEAGALTVDTVLATNVASVSVSCSPNSDCSGAPTTITVTIVETLDTSTTTAPYTYSLTAAFRQVNGGGAPLPSNIPSSPVILLGGPCTSGTAGILVSGSGSVQVNGRMYVNTVDGSGCSAMDLSGGGTYSAAGTSILNGGGCVQDRSGSTCPTPTYYSPAFGDPYAGVVPPTTSGRPSQSGCAGTAQPGVYSSTLSIQGGLTCTLASGVYILQNGLSVGNGGTLKSAPGGVTIYITGGSFIVNGGANVLLTGSTTGSWPDMVVWQAAADTNMISFSNGGTITLAGILYAPGAQLRVDGGAYAPTITTAVVRTIYVTGGAHVILGIPLSIGASGFPPSNWTVNRPYPSITLIPAGGDGDYTWSVTGMPAGMRLDPNTGVVSGTPTVVASGSATVTLSDGRGDPPSVQSFTLNIVATPTITTASLPAGDIGVPYAVFSTNAGGTTPLVWSASNLPAGLAINSLTGVISGTPTAVGTKMVSVTLTDAAGATDVNAYTLVVNNLPTITTVSLAPWTINQPYLAQVSATAGSTPYFWTASNLPAGLTIDAQTGVITGTATTSGTVTVSVTVADAADGSDTNSFGLTMNAPPTITTASLPTWTVNRAYSTTVTGTGGTTPRTWSASNLPAGLAINSLTGVISGTPTAVSVPTVSITLTDTSGATDVNTFIMEIDDPPTISTSSLPAWTINRPYLAALVGLDGTTPYSFTSTALPAGLSMTTDGIISGTPTALGSTAVTFTLADAAGATAPKSLTIVIAAAPTISTSALASGEKTVPYSATLTGAAGTTPYNWTSGALPAGLTLSTDGVLSGTPTVNGSFPVVYTLTDAAGATVTKSLTLTLATSPTITSGPKAWTVNRVYSFALAASGGTGPYTWAATSLPTGLAMTTAGVISGTPTAAAAYAITVTVTDAKGGTLTNPYTFTINPTPTISTLSLPAKTVNRPYSATIAGTPGTTTYVFTSTALPAGLTMTTAGVISGTSTTVGSTAVTFTLTDAAGATATKSLTIVINPVPNITTASPLPAGEKTVVYSKALAATGGTTAYGWTSTGLPTGLTLSSTTGVISGTPSVVGTFTVAVTLTDASGSVDTASLTLDIDPQPSVTNVVLANAATGGTAGRVGSDDTITVVFSAQMKVSTLCSAWTSGDTNNQLITANGAVTVTLTDSTNDTITVTSTACTFNFGSINLGSGYLTGTAAKFSGSFSSASTIAWTANTHTLVITLGAQSSGSTPSTVASSTPIYTPSTSIRDTPGAAVSPTTFTLPTIRQF
jgi:hypothetical protein